MKYNLTPIFCRPWLLNGLSLKLIESHYENNYGGALRRLNAITERLESLDFANTPGGAYGFHVGCNTARALREAGFDAKYMKGGHSGWRAIGGPVKLHA
jgi:hypothetical protein